MAEEFFFVQKGPIWSDAPHKPHGRPVVADAFCLVQYDNAPLLIDGGHPSAVNIRRHVLSNVRSGTFQLANVPFVEIGQYNFEILEFFNTRSILSSTVPWAVH